MQEMLARAKLNLTLNVGNQRNGYHELASLICFSAWGERICLQKAAQSSLVAHGTYAAALEQTHDNLLLRALAAVEAHIGSVLPTAIDIHKEIPLGSGLGGGSSDAATMIIGLNHLWELGLDEAACAALARPLGADVPACLLPHQAASAAWMTGIGHDIIPLAPLPAFDIVIIPLAAELSTLRVFAQFDARDDIVAPLLFAPPPRFAGLAALIDYIAARDNDLQAAAIALAPQIATHIDILERAGALVARVSGSGGACFGIWHSGAAHHANIDIPHIVTRMA